MEEWEDNDNVEHTSVNYSMDDVSKVQYNDNGEHSSVYCSIDDVSEIQYDEECNNNISMKGDNFLSD